MTQPTVKLGGKEWKLRYDTNAIAEIEEALHGSIREIGIRMSKGKMGVREVRALIWAGLLHEVEDLGIRQVGLWIDEAGFLKDEKTRDAFVSKALEALQLAFPQQVKTDGSDPN